MIADQDAVALQNRLKLSEQAKEQYLNSKREENLGLKVKDPAIVFDSRVETLEGVLKEWQRRVEANIRVAAENYVEGALKTRSTDMEAFTKQMANFEEFIGGFREAMSDVMVQTITQGIEEIRTELAKRNANLPKENEVLDELMRVLREY